MRHLINTPLLGDCFDIFPHIKSASVDMILCDLPYGTTACKWDSILPFDQLWKAYERIVKPSGAIVLTASQPFTSLLINSNINFFKYCWIWDKISCSGNMLAKKQPLRAYEDICVFYKSQPVYNPVLRDKPKDAIRVNNIDIVNRSKTHIQTQTKRHQNRIIPFDKSYPSNVIRINNMGKGCKRIHPTQKPVALFEYLIKTYSNEGDLILDNCAGSFTTAVACENLKRNWICIEKDVEIFEKGNNRVINHLKTTI